jgi:hypothetical protein
VAPLQVSAQAIIKWLDVLPAALLGQAWTEVCMRLQTQAPPALPHLRWASAQEYF